MRYSFATVAYLTAGFSPCRLKTSHFAVPMARLYGWLPSSRPYGSFRNRTARKVFERRGGKSPDAQASELSVVIGDRSEGVFLSYSQTKRIIDFTFKQIY